jgi:hypothetical protein
MFVENTTPFPSNFTMAFDQKGHEQVILATKVTLDLPPQGQSLCQIADTQSLLFDADIFGPDPAKNAMVFENDFAPFKPFCDVLLHGAAHAPQGQAVTELDVGIRMGGWSKRFTVHGQRIWLKSAAGFSPSGKRAFTVLPISYDFAYGGTDVNAANPDQFDPYELNPVGLGYYPLSSDIEGRALATTSEFGGDSSSRNGATKPMAFGPIGRSWLPRRRYVGTYDDSWTENRMPLLPVDFNERYFQAAAEDQQVVFPIGGEPIELVNLSAKGRITTQMPSLQIVAMFERKSGRITQRIANLDTVLFLPEDHQMCLTFRTRITAERDLFEFSRVLVSSRLLGGLSNV